MTAPEKKLAKELVNRIFQETASRLILPTVCTKILDDMSNEGLPLLEEALDSLNCNQSDYYAEMEDIQPISKFLIEQLNTRGKANIISRYRRADSNQLELIRTDFLQESPSQTDTYARMLLNEKAIQQHLLEDENDQKKDSDFEKLCAVYLKDYWGCVNVGVLRETPSKDGGLDFFGIEQKTEPEARTVGYFGQAKRQSKVSSTSVGQWLEQQYAKGFQPMTDNAKTYHGYVLRDGTDIHKRLRDKASSFLEADRFAPMLICAGHIAPTDVKRVQESPHYGRTRHGIRFIQEVCIAISKKDEEGFDSWFEDDFPHNRFIPDAFDEWLEGQHDSLIIVDKET